MPTLPNSDELIPGLTRYLAIFFFNADCIMFIVYKNKLNSIVCKRSDYQILYIGRQ